MGLQGNWLGGRHEQCNIYRDGALRVDQAVAGGVSVAAGTELDALVDSEAFRSVCIFHQKQAILTGLAQDPVSGYSAAFRSAGGAGLRKTISESLANALQPVGSKVRHSEFKVYQVGYTL